MQNYIAAVLFMAGIFICGYKVGNFFGWREGFRIAKALELQRREGVWRRNQPQHRDGSGEAWDYNPKNKGATAFTPQPLRDDDNKQKN